MPVHAAPKLHNAMWPGLVGKGTDPGQKPPIGLERMLALTAAAGTRRIAETFREAARIAADHGQRLAAEGEICWAGMHSWRDMLDLLEEVGMPEVVGFQADLAHTYLYLLGYNAPEHGKAVLCEKPLALDVADLLAALAADRPCPPTFRDALETQRVCAAVLASAETRQWTAVSS